MPERVWLVVVTAVVGLGLFVAGAGAGSGQKQGGTLRIGAVADFESFDSLDPAVAYNWFTWSFEFATCAKLYNYPDKPAPEGAIVRPEVAAGLPSVSKDGKTQTIELRRTYRFNNGARITAANFVAAFNRDANPNMQSPAVQYLHEIVGADAVIAGEAQTIPGVKALGPYTLQIRTTRPLFDLVSRLTMPFFCPIAVDTPLGEIDDPPGSGPYYIASHIPNRQLVLKRNPFYHGSRPVHVDEVVFTFGVGSAACQEAAERDEFDYCLSIQGVPPTARRDIVARYGLNRPGGQVFFNPVLATYYLAFNHDRPAFKMPGQIPLKQAINWALDRHALAAATGYLSGRRTDQILPPAIGRNASIYPLGPVTERRLAKARALLAKATFRPKTLVLYAGNFGAFPAEAQIVRYNLKRLGIDVEIKYFGPDVLQTKAGTRGARYDVLLTGWIADYADPITFFATLDGTNITKAGTINNYAYFDRPRYNRAIRRIEGLSGEAREQAWADLDVEMMRDDPPWAPFLNGAQVEFVSPSLGCYVFQPVYALIDIAAACKK